MQNLLDENSKQEICDFINGKEEIKENKCRFNEGEEIKIISDNVLIKKLINKKDFFKQPSTLEDLEIRYKYDNNFDIIDLPKNQNYILYWTYGPIEKEFDVISKHIGICVLGVFKEKKDAWEHFDNLCKKNPYLISINMHCHELGQDIDFTCVNIKDIKDHELNKEHESIIKQHLQEKLNLAKKVELNKAKTLKEIKQRTLKIKHFDNFKKDYFEEKRHLIKHNLLNEELESKVDNILFEDEIDYSVLNIKESNEENEILNKKLESFKKEERLETLPYDMLYHYIYSQKKDISNKEVKSFFLKHKDEEGNIFLLQKLVKTF